MKRGSRILLLVGSLMMLMLLDVPPWVPARTGFVGEAAAVIGRPLTPLSYAGVARRTTRRTVAYSSAAAASYTAAPAPAPAPARPAGAPPVGTVVSKLPTGCVSSPQNGVEFFNCNGVFYRPVVQGNNLVYMVENP